MSLILSLALLVGCHIDSTQPADRSDPFAPEAPAGVATRSGVMLSSTTDEDQLIVDTDNGELALVSDGAWSSVELGGEPTRAVRFGDRVWVTLRAAGELAEVRVVGEELVLARKVAVGAEPFDVVVSEDGARLYVSLSQQGEVVQLDAGTLAVASRYAVPGEPRWMAVGTDPWTEREQVFVALFRGGRVVQIDTQSGEQRTRDFPRARVTEEAGCEDELLVPRITGELQWDALEDVLWVVGTYVDTRVPISPSGEAMELDCKPASDPGLNGDARDTGGFDFPPPAPGEDRPSSSEGGYGSVSIMPSIGRFNPVLVRFDLVTEGAPIAWFLNGTLSTENMFGQSVLRGHPVSLDLVRGGAPSALSVAVGVESDGAVVQVFPYAGPVFNVVDLPVATASTVMVSGGATSVRIMPVYGSETIFAWSRFSRVSDASFGGGRYVVAPPSELPSDVMVGRRLFSLSDDPRMVAPGAGVACVSCHTEGRNDGLTWRFPDMHRQTPTLAGGVSATAPFTWTADVPSVAREAELTVSLRMGGTGVDPVMARQIAAYVDWTRAVALPEPTAEETELLALGREVFHRPEVGCATCHNDANGASAMVVSMHGVERIGVPALRGVAATAPYLHDGSAETLRDVLERSRDGSMGDTSSLDAREMKALEAWVKHFGR